MDEREAGRVKGRKARLLWMIGKLGLKGKTIVEEREGGTVKGRKARLLWMRGKLAGCEERLDCCG